MLPLIVFFAIVAAALFLGGCYVFGGWLVRKRPNSPWGSALAKLPLFASFLEKGTQENEKRGRTARERVTTTIAQTLHNKRWSFQQLGEGDSIVVTQPDTGEEITFRTAGTAVMRELIQEDDSVKTNPWTSTGRDLTFQVLAGAREEWLLELPNKFLALITSITRVGDAEVAAFIKQAQLFGGSKQSDDDIQVEWGRGISFIWDIGRVGVHSAAGERAPWNAAPVDPDDGPWEKRYMQKFLLAGPEGGKKAKHQAGESLLMVLAQSGGTGGFVLEGFLVTEDYLQDVRMEG